MSCNRNVPVIALGASYDEMSREYVKHERTVMENGETEKIECRCPKLHEEAEPLEILKFLSTFARTHQDMSWITGVKLFQKFPAHLTGYHLDFWEMNVDGMN